MANQQPESFMDTVQSVVDVSAAAPGHAGDDFAATVQHPEEIWPEAADFQCSESASLFAGTQPAPMNIV